MSIDVHDIHPGDPSSPKSPDFVEHLIETVREPLLVLDGALRIRRANRAFYQSFRMASVDTEGRRIYEAGDGRWDIPWLRALLEEDLPRTGRVENFEVEHEFPGIGERSMRINAHWGDGGSDPYVIVAIEDITTRKRVERRCEETEVRLQALVDSVVDAIVTIDECGTIRSVNAATERMFGYRADELIGQNVRSIIPAYVQEWHDSHVSREVEPGETRRIGGGREVQGLRKEGSTFPIELLVSEYNDRGQPMFTGILRDLSARKALEQEVLEAATLEQQRIGQELHDTSAQELAALGLLADSLVAGLKGESPELGGIAGKMADGLRRVLGQIRAFSRGLIRVELDSGGLMVALTELAAQTTALHGLSCTFESRGAVGLSNNETATQLYSIAREAVTNALKHAGPSHVRIILEGDGPSVTLRVEDDGVGLAQARVDVRGMGLKIMRYRAGLIGAHLAIGTTRAGGTVVSCVCLKKDQPHDPA